MPSHLTLEQTFHALVCGADDTADPWARARLRELADTVAPAAAAVIRLLDERGNEPTSAAAQPAQPRSGGRDAYVRRADVIAALEVALIAFRQCWIDGLREAGAPQSEDPAAAGEALQQVAARAVAILDAALDDVPATTFEAPASLRRSTPRRRS